MQNFTNQNPSRLSAADFASTAATYGLTSAHLTAIAQVEGSGSGYLPDNRPKILFEAHVFSRLTAHKHDASHPSISSPSWNRALYRGGANEYPRLQEALALDETAALQRASWGLFQIMGSNFAAAGYSNVQSFVSDHVAGGEQIARDAADANLAAYADLQAKSKHLAAVISQLESEKSARNAVLKSARDEVGRVAAQPGDDGPIAPALRSALDALRSAP